MMPGISVAVAGSTDGLHKMIPDQAARNGLGSPRRAVLWLDIAGILAAAIGFSWDPTPLAQALAAIFIACALIHAGRALILFAGKPFAFAMENVGAAMGFPFGSYHFEVGARLPHVSLIPVIVGPLCCGCGSLV